MYYCACSIQLRLDSHRGSRCALAKCRCDKRARRACVRAYVHVRGASSCRRRFMVTELNAPSVHCIVVAGRSSTPGVDRMFVMCKHVFYDECWIDTVQGQPPRPCNETGSSPDEYTTYVEGHTSMPTHVHHKPPSESVRYGRRGNINVGCSFCRGFRRVSGFLLFVDPRTNQPGWLSWLAVL